ncbi:hypothetical protein ACFQ7B_42875 [Streptomyces erythrochromogenes]|uniref:hypothetical protein n=1 Tax=Streptomyces erythrochromogenes TaxID=285574 RepID=UPI00367A69D7
MNAQDLFAGYDVHANAEEMAAEAVLEGAGSSGASFSCVFTVPNAVSTGAITGFHGAVTGR